MAGGAPSTHWEVERRIRKRKGPTGKRGQEKRGSKGVRGDRRAKGEQRGTGELRDHEG